MKFSHRFKFRASLFLPFNFHAPGFRAYLIFAHTIVRANNIRHFICNSTYTFHICHARSSITYDRLVTMHKMLYGKCPEKLKNRFTCRYTCFFLSAISRNLIFAHLLKGNISNASNFHTAICVKIKYFRATSYSHSEAA